MVIADGLSVVSLRSELGIQLVNDPGVVVAAQMVSFGDSDKKQRC
jgi:hypothetical protein